MFDAKTLDAWLTHIEVLHSKPIDLGLDRMKTMVERMGLDFSSRTVITVGGTNGKGSTCAMLESVVVFLLFLFGQALGVGDFCQPLEYLMLSLERHFFQCLHMLQIINPTI